MIGKIVFGLVDVLLVQVKVVRHVGKVGQGHKQVVLHTSGRSRPIPDILILKPYSYVYTVLIITRSLSSTGVYYFDGANFQRSLLLQRGLDL